MLKDLIVQKVFASTGVSSTSWQGMGGFSTISSLNDIVTLVVNILMFVGWAAVIVMVAMGFIQYTVSQGDKAKVETAQKWLTYAIVGGLGLALVAAIKAILMNITGENNLIQI